MKKISILAIVITSLSIDCISQTDTIHSPSRYDTTDIKFNSVYQLFIVNQNREINHLWKFDLVQLNSYYLNLGLGFEYKMGRSFSAESYLKVIFIDYGVSLSMKYYYNLARRERIGKNTNGFSGNYISVGGFFNHSPFISSIPIICFTNEPQISHYGLNLLCGMQRRIGNIGYIDLFLGLEAFKSYDYFSTGNTEYVLNPKLGIRAGFAIDSFKNLRRMLK